MTLKAPQSNGLTTVTSKFLLKLAMATLLLLSSPVFAQTKVTMQLRWLNQFQFAGYYAALHKNFYKNAGLDVTLKEGGPSISAINEVLAGHADFGVSTSGLVKDYLDGKPVLMLAPIIQHSPQVLLSLGKKLGNPADIARAGPISLQPGDESLELKAIFISEGISLEKLKITSAGGLNDLVAGKIVAMNAYLSNEPFWLQRHGIVYSVIKPESYGMDFYSDVLFTTQAMEKTQPEIVASFRDATLKGWQYALDHPEEMIDLILTHYNTQGKSRDQLNFEAKTLINLISPDLVQIGYSNPGRWRHIADTFARFDLVSSDRDLKGFFYQADRKPDITWLYPYLAAALGILGIVSAVSFYICRINFRLRQATRNQAIVESRLREMAFTDALTQLPNRRLLLDRLKQALNSSKRQCSYGAVIFLDLNEFKQLNDTHGHNVGDQLLIEVANRLQLLVRASDTVARLGGDEFVVLLVNLGAELLHATAHANSIAEKIKSALNEEYVLGDIRHHGSASVGIKLFIGDQVDPDQVLHEADEAMYESKKGLVNE